VSKVGRKRGYRVGAQEHKAAWIKSVTGLEQESYRQGWGRGRNILLVEVRWREKRTENYI
jgi:hypothetical protein